MSNEIRYFTDAVKQLKSGMNRSKLFLIQCCFELDGG